jgi:hypothetical protein
MIEDPNRFSEISDEDILDGFPAWHPLSFDEFLSGGRLDRTALINHINKLAEEADMPEDRLFPEDDAERQTYPIGTFICEFFPHALAELARFSHKQQQKHNPDGPIGWAKDKSVWSIDRVFRHAMEAQRLYNEGDIEAAGEEFKSLAWRSLEGLERLLTKMEPFDEE